jgi:RNA polymerase primary sigma factor
MLCVGRVYLHQIGAVSLLSAEEEVALAKQLQAGLKAKKRLAKAIRNPDETARLQQRVALGRQAQRHLTEANLRLVVDVAKHYLHRGMNFLDLIQEGNIGLLKAVEKFDPTLGYRFSTYATWWIRQAIGRAMANQTRAIRIPVHVRAIINRVTEIEHRWLLETGREPSAREIAVELEFLSEDEVQAIKSYQSNGTPLSGALEDRWQAAARKVRRIKWIPREPVSLNALIGSEENSSLAEFVEAENEGSEATVTASSLKEHMRLVLQDLSPQEREVLITRHGLADDLALTLEEVGRKFGVTRERIRQIEGKALRKLRHPMRSNILKDYRR